jgi:two-component system cell cycle sensor histidine kinase/response regulator CckA
MTSSDPIRILIVENEGLVGCDMAATLGKLGHHVVGICASGRGGALAPRRAPAGPRAARCPPRRVSSMASTPPVSCNAAASVSIVYVTGLCRSAKRSPVPARHIPRATCSSPSTTTSCDWPSRWPPSATLEESANASAASTATFEAFQSLADGVIAADLAGGVVFMNPGRRPCHRLVAGGGRQGARLNEVFRIYQASGEPAEDSARRCRRLRPSERTVLFDHPRR